jgi:cytoskeletal protein CcmA (bactofilin family)
MSDRKTVLEEGTTFKGTLNATTPVVVMGDLEGDITGPEV